MNQETLNYFRNELRTTRAELAKAKQELEQRDVQLAGCSVAALGWATGEQDAAPGSYGYSASYADVKTLRTKWEQSEADLSEALEVISRFEASCICQAVSTGKPCFDCQAAARLRERRAK